MSLRLAALVAAAAVYSSSAIADDSAGRIVIDREVPVHDAFRSADAGAASTVATSPAGLGERSPQIMSDSALRGISGHASSATGTMRQVPGPEAIRSAGSPLPASALANGTPLSPAFGTALSGGLAPATGAIAGLLGGALK